MGFGPDLLRTRDYAGFREIWEGLTRKLFANFSYVPCVRAFRSHFRRLDSWRERHAGIFSALLGGGALMAGLGGLALTGLPAIGWVGAPVPAFLAYAVLVHIHRQYARLLGVRWDYSLLAPLAYAVYAGILLVAAGRVLSGRGLTWRGRRIY
jgi:hypothetical protein